MKDVSEGMVGGGALSCFFMRCDTTPTPTQSPNTLTAVLKRSLHQNEHSYNKVTNCTKESRTIAKNIFNSHREERKETHIKAIKCSGKI